MGANIIELEDGLIIYPAQLSGAIVSGHQDHRIALALVIAALGAMNEMTVIGTECINKTIPLYIDEFRALQGNIAEVVAQHLLNSID